MRKQILGAVSVAVSVSVFGQQIPVFKVDYSTQDGNQLVLTNARVDSSGIQTPYLHGAWAIELERSTNFQQTWQGIYTNTTDSLPATGTLEDVPLPPQAPSKNAMTDSGISAFANYRAKVAPCLNCKTVVAYHFRPGWNGFTPPFTNKYLVRTMRVEWVTVINGVTNESFGSPWSAVSKTDRVTGALTFTTDDTGFPLFGDLTFPFGTTNIASQPGWTVTDDHYQAVSDSGAGSNPRYIHTTDVWLSVPMTMGMAEHDTQYLIDTTISNAPWGSLTSVWWGSCDPATCGDSGNAIFAMQDMYPAPLCPPTRWNATDPAQQPWGVGSAAAAGSLYVPCNWGGWSLVPDESLYVAYDTPEMYCKWGTIVRGPWGWTLNTSVFATSEAQPFLTGSQFVTTDCGGIINVQAPPPADGTNWCIVALPDTAP